MIDDPADASIDASVTILNQAEAAPPASVPAIQASPFSAVEIHAIAEEDTRDDEANAAREPLSEEIDRWFVEAFHNSPVSRDMAIFNHVRSAVDDLKQRLAAL